MALLPPFLPLLPSETSAPPLERATWPRTEGCVWPPTWMRCGLLTKACEQMHPATSVSMEVELTWGDLRQLLPCWHLDCGSLKDPGQEGSAKPQPDSYLTASRR